MRELEKSLENSRLTPSASTGTKGDRFNSGKPEISMVLEARHAMEGAARVLEFGKRKYSRGNWRKGLSHTQTSDCLLRHLTKWLAGEDNDDETGLPHLDHVLVNALFLSELSRTHPELDDRYLPNEGTKNVEAVSKAPLPPKQLELLLQGGRIDPDKFPKHYEYQQLGKSKPDDYDPYRYGFAGDSKL